MKIQLDFTNKIIKVEENVNFFELTKKLKSILPDWKEWILSSAYQSIYWSNPIIWDWNKPYFYHAEPQFTGNTQTVCLETN